MDAVFATGATFIGSAVIIWLSAMAYYGFVKGDEAAKAQFLTLVIIPLTMYLVYLFWSAVL